MFARNVFALALAAALGVSMSAAYADNDHRDSRDYRNDHRDSRDYHRDYRRDRYEHERHDVRVRHDYVVARPVFVSSPILYAQPVPSSLNIVIPIRLP
jgi:hypothetical protein